MAAPVFCTKIASKLTRTYTDRHGLKNLIEELLGEDISKQQQSSDWGAPGTERSAARICRLRRALSSTGCAKILVARLEREGRMELAQACFDFLPARARLDIAGWADTRYLQPRVVAAAAAERPMTVEADLKRDRRRAFAAPGGSLDRIVALAGASACRRPSA